MTSLRLTDHEWATARTVCTQKQILALDLWRRGAGKKRIGLILSISTAAARDRVDSGLKRLADHLERTAA